MSGFRLLVFEAIESGGAHGATSSEIAHSLGCTVRLVNGAIQPLLREGKIERLDCKRTFKGPSVNGGNCNRYAATVWVVNTLIETEREAA